MKKSFATLLIFLAACTPSPAATQLSPTTVIDPTLAPSATPMATATLAPTATQIPIEFNDAEFLERPEQTSFRFMDYNINWDSIFPEGQRWESSLRRINREEEFARLVRAIQPDILCLQEIEAHRDPQLLADMLAEITGNPNWVATSARDSVIATHYTFIDGYDFDLPNYPPELPQAVAMINLPDDLFGNQDVLVTCSHFKAANANSDIKLRQRQADILINRIGDAITPGGIVDLPLNTPIIMAGDYNIYDTDPAYHLVTLMTGDIVDEERYGPDIKPDWDGTDLADVHPSINNEGIYFYTWRDDGSYHNPGPLDRILYTDSQLTVINSFVLNTTLLSDFAFDLYGLDFADVLYAGELGNYDHLPLVADFVLISGQ